MAGGHPRDSVHSGAECPEEAVDRPMVPTG